MVLPERSATSRYALFAIGLGFQLLAGCSVTFNSSPELCSPDRRTELLNVTLEEWTPSSPFTIGAGADAWIQVTKDPASAEGLFGKLSGIAELYSIPSGATPNITTEPNGCRDPHDPSITIDKALTWQELKLKAGAWQLYSFSNPGIEVVSCPQG